MATSKARLAELGMVPPLANEIANNLPGLNTGVVALTPLTGAFGTTGSAIVDVTGTFSQTILNNNFRALEDKINAVISALKS